VSTVTLSGHEINFDAAVDVMDGDLRETKNFPLFCQATGKCLSDINQADQIAARRFAQGRAHFKQGRIDLLGVCEHYDKGYYFSA
tara:strand:- start:2730 stop:2984 length:255 start_codon:yes stop_codon:yes gene_type:complete